MPYKNRINLRRFAPHVILRVSSA